MSLLISTLVAATMLVSAPAVEAQTGRTVTVRSNGFSRGEIHAAYYHEFISSGPPATGFNGNANTCNAGSLSTSYLQDQVDRINWFRLIAGVDMDVRLDTSRLGGAQQAALIAARNPLSHSPSSSSTCYSDAGAAIAGVSNLHKDSGVSAINGYMHDYGSSNQPVGHRRWLLNPGLGSVAIGEIPETSHNSYDGGHAVSVLTDWNSPAARNPEALIWPASGFVPTSTFYPRWSISVAGADFGAATVSVRRNGASVSAPVVFRTPGTQATRGPRPALVFELSGSALPSATADTSYQVTVSNVSTPNGTTSYTWWTTAFNADVSPPQGSSSGTGSQVSSNGSISTKLVNATYIDLVGRNATAAEVQYWQSMVGSTGDRSQLVRELALSDTWIRSVIDALYLKALARPADSGGLAFWTSEIRRGVPVRDVAARFYSSPEYVRSSGTTTQWIERLYVEVLGRKADAGGLQYWVNETNRTSHVDVALRFYQSTESRQARVDGLYLKLLDRRPDSAGRNFWVGQMTTMDDIALATFLASSVEYRSSNS